MLKKCLCNKLKRLHCPLYRVLSDSEKSHCQSGTHWACSTCQTDRKPQSWYERSRFL